MCVEKNIFSNLKKGNWIFVTKKVTKKATKKVWKRKKGVKLHKM